MLIGLIAKILLSNYTPIQRSTMDWRNDPKEERTFSSPNKRFTLRVLTLDHWKTRNATAIFSKSGKELWRLVLPHSHGPRDIAVTDSGYAVLFDEAVNINSDRAISILSPKGKTTRIWSHDDLCHELGQTSEQVMSHAKRGWWMSENPITSNEIVSIPAGGKMLEIHVKTATLQVRPSKKL